MMQGSLVADRESPDLTFQPATEDPEIARALLEARRQFTMRAGRAPNVASLGDLVNLLDLLPTDQSLGVTVERVLAVVERRAD